MSQMSNFRCNAFALLVEDALSVIWLVQIVYSGIIDNLVAVEICDAEIVDGADKYPPHW